MLSNRFQREKERKKERSIFHIYDQSLNSYFHGYNRKARKKMKNKASHFLKRIFSSMTSVVRSKSTAIKNKTAAARGRLLLFTLVNKNKLVLSSLSNKIHGLLSHGDGSDDDDDDDDDVRDESKAIVLYRAEGPCSSSTSVVEKLPDGEECDDKYPDLRHSLFNEEEESDFEDDPGRSVIDIMKDSREGGEDFRLEDEIDHVADLFIKRFHKQIRLQKLESFKRFQAMLERSM